MNIESNGPPYVFRHADMLNRPFDETFRTLQAIDAALQPFLEEGWLTTVDTTNPRAQPRESALTVVITGTYPIPTIPNSQNRRYMFYDAPLKELDQNPLYTPEVSPMASATFSSIVGARWVIPRLARGRILHYVRIAHDKGIAVRITEPIDFPVWLRCVVAPFLSSP